MPVQIDIDIPKSCFDCPFTHYNDNYRKCCSYLKEDIDYDGYTMYRYYKCPLKEIK